MSAVTQQSVQDEVADWKHRLEDLFADIQRAADQVSGVHVRRIEVQPRQEELMKQFRVPPPRLEKLVIEGTKGTMELVPFGLWVIGANGRLDVFVNGVAHILADIGSPSEPRWTLYGRGDRLRGVPFDSGLIEQLISSIA